MVSFYKVVLNSFFLLASYSLIDGTKAVMTSAPNPKISSTLKASLSFVGYKALPFYLAAHLAIASDYPIYFPSISKMGTYPNLKKPACFFCPKST